MRHHAQTPGEQREHAATVARERRYEPGSLLTMADVAELWGIAPKTVRWYRYLTLHGKTHLLPPTAPGARGKPLWLFEDVQRFQRPGHRWWDRRR